MKTSRSYYAVRREGTNLLPLSWEDLLAEQFGNRNKTGLQILQYHLQYHLLSSAAGRGNNLPIGWASRRELWQPAYFTHMLGREDSRYGPRTQPEDRAVLAEFLSAAVVGEKLAIPVSEEQGCRNQKNLGSKTCSTTGHVNMSKQPTLGPQFPHLYNRWLLPRFLTHHLALY